MVLIMAMGPFILCLKFTNTLMGWHKAAGWLALPVTILSPLTAGLRTFGIGESGSKLQVAAHPVGLSEAIAVAEGGDDIGHLVSARRFRGAPCCCGLRATAASRSP